MAASNKHNRQSANPGLDERVIELGKAEDSHWQETEDLHAPALGDFQLPEELRLHEFGELADFSDDDSLANPTSEPTIPAFDASNDASFLEKDIDSKLLALLLRLTDRRLLLAGLLCSLILHLIAGGVLVNLEPEEHVINTPMQVQVRLIPENPLLVDNEVLPDEPLQESLDTAEEQAVEESPEQAPEAVVEIVDEQLIPEPAPIIEETVEVEIAETEVAEPLLQEQPVAPPVLVVPSSAEVARSIETMEDADRSRLWAYDCNARQEESDLLNCDRQATPDYNIVLENSTYRDLNPTREISRSLRTLPTVAENAGELAGRLQSVNIPEGLGEYLMEEVEAGISHNSNLGNLPIYNIQIMTDNSDSAKFFRETRTDPWRTPGLMTEFKEKQQRQVHEQ